MSFNLPTFQIPFNSIGYNVTIDFSHYSQYTNLPWKTGSQVSYQSGCTIRLNNQTDNLLAVVFPRSGVATTLSPGANDVLDIPKSETEVQLTVLQCSPYQVYPIETMAPTFYTQQDGVASTRGGYISNPNTPAQAVTPGTFVSGVFIPAAQVLPGAFVGGAWQFSSTPANTFSIVLI